MEQAFSLSHGCAIEVNGITYVPTAIRDYDGTLVTKWQHIEQEASDLMHEEWSLAFMRGDYPETDKEARAEFYRMVRQAKREGNHLKSGEYQIGNHTFLYV